MERFGGGGDGPSDPHGAVSSGGSGAEPRGARKGDGPRASRRGFLERLLGLGAAAAAALIRADAPPSACPGPRARTPLPEREAEFWRPHDLAG